MSIQDAFNFAKQTLDTAFYTNIGKFVANHHKLEQCLSFFSDEQSKIYYQSEIAHLMLRAINTNLAEQISPFTTQDWQNITNQWTDFCNSPQCPQMVAKKDEASYLANMLMTTFIAKQYQYNNIFTVQKGDVFIDCGACFGDTALWAYQNGAKTVYSFEPSPYNFDILVKNLKNNNQDSTKCYNLAVGHEKCKIPFAAQVGLAGASRACSNGNIEVDCIRLDDFINDHKIKPNFIKFDIEGAELSALKGCALSIQKYQPKLAVCLYHKVEDMWELPLYIKSLVPKYRFYCRKNNVDNEFILYAIV